MTARPAPRLSSKWLRIAYQRSAQVIDEQAAVTRTELEARVSESGPANRRPNPHYVTAAMRWLLAEGAVQESEEVPTRGGSAYTVLHIPTSIRGNKERVSRASARKRLLSARYLGWTRATKRQPLGLIGAGGERVVRASFRDAKLTGTYAMVHPDGREVTHLLGDRVPGGPLDEAAWYAGSPSGVPGLPTLLAVEVKNIREWIYPRAPELHRLLYKASLLQQRHPGVSLVPVLISRKRNYMTFSMARELGFLTLEVHEQFILPSAAVSEEHLDEVRSGLGFQSLVRTSDPHPPLVEMLASTVPKHAVQSARRWSELGARFTDHYKRLLNEHLSVEWRGRLLSDLRKAVAAEGSSEGGW